MFKPEELGPENSNEKFNTLQRTMTLNAWDGRLTRELQFVKQLRDKFPQVEIRDCSPIVWELRKIKSPAEIDVLRRAARIGVKAHRALIQSTRPGVAGKVPRVRLRVRLRDSKERPARPTARSSCPGRTTPTATITPTTGS